MADFTIYPFAYLRGTCIKQEEATIHIYSQGLQYGIGAFGGIRGYITDDKENAYLFRIEDHYTRLLNSLRIVGKPSSHTVESLKKIMFELLKMNKPKDNFYLRPFFYAQELKLSPDITKITFDFGLFMIPLEEYLPVSKGLQVGVSSWTRISDTMIPSRGKLTGGYINSAIAKAEAIENGYDEAIFLSSNGHVAEGTAENLFIVRDGILITTPEYTDVLEGVTRKTIFVLAKDLGIPVVVREIDRSELYVADEAFFSGTGVQVAWIAAVDRRVVGTGKIGPISEKLQKLYFNVVRGKEKKYEKWLTKI